MPKMSIGPMSSICTGGAISTPMRTGVAGGICVSEMWKGYDMIDMVGRSGWEERELGLVILGRRSY